MLSLALALHVLSAVVWVGGMVFAYVFLRPAAGPLAAAERLGLWSRVFARFLAVVWAAVVLIVLTGYHLLFAVWHGFAAAPLYVHAMQGIGLVMALLFLHLWFAPYRRFKQAMAAGDLPAAATRLDQIRLIVHVNMMLGLIVVAVATAGRMW